MLFLPFSPRAAVRRTAAYSASISLLPEASVRASLMLSGLEE